MARTRQDLQVEKGQPRTAADVQALLGPEPLLEGEDLAAYQALRDHIRSAVEPKDAIEEFWVRDVVDLLWEILRLRRLKASLMRLARPDGLSEVLSRLVTNQHYEKDFLVAKWAQKDCQALQKVEAILRTAGLDESAIAAATLAIKIDTLERVERLIAQIEARRNATLREIERRREAVSRRLRDAGKIIEDGEFSEILEPAEERRKDEAALPSGSS